MKLTTDDVRRFFDKTKNYVLKKEYVQKLYEGLDLSLSEKKLFSKNYDKIIYNKIINNPEVYDEESNILYQIAKDSGDSDFINIFVRLTTAYAWALAEYVILLFREFYILARAKREVDIFIKEKNKKREKVRVKKEKRIWHSEEIKILKKFLVKKNKKKGDLKNFCEKNKLTLNRSYEAIRTKIYRIQHKKKEEGKNEKERKQKKTKSSYSGRGRERKRKWRSAK